MSRMTGVLAPILVIAGWGLAGCGGQSTSDGAPPSTTTSPTVLFDPVAASAIVPFPNDLFFNGTTDSTLNIPNASAAPFVDQANLLDGFSTVESAFLDILGDVDLATVGAGIRIFNATAGVPLTQGVDYTVTRSPVILSRTRLLIKPLRPLNPRSNYIVFATNDLMTPAGIPLVESIMFAAVKSADPVGSPGNPTPATSPPLTPTQVATLEAIRQALQPVFNNVAPAFGLTRADIVLAWTFTTQSIGNTLNLLNAAAVARPIGVANTGLNTGQLGLPLAPTANVYAGTIDLPYYLTPGLSAQDTNPLTKFWESNGISPGGNSSVPGNPPCAAFNPSFSTTFCFPTPVLKSTVTVPVLVTVPNSNSQFGATPPPGGWPVVIFQHGITRNRTDMFAIAPTLANAGFVTVAIDHPLHGITDASNPLYAGPIERTFNLDLAPPVGPDPSGSYYINLASLLTSRDNLRQSVIDLINLAKSVDGLNLDGNAMTDDINELNINFVGHSLGGIAGGTLLGVNSSDYKAATLAMPGGGIAKLLDGSATFGPVIAGGLFAANAALLEGQDSYETFLRFAQTVIDSADPINYAVAAAANHPIHMIEVIGESGISLPDQVVPNNVPRTVAAPAPCPTYTGTGVPPGARGPVCVAGLLSGTDPLYMMMGLTPVDVTPPVAAAPPAGADTVVRYRRGDHGSILDPTASAATTCEMQRQTATFMATGGTVIPFGPAACP